MSWTDGHGQRLLTEKKWRDTEKKDSPERGARETRSLTLGQQRARYTTFPVQLFFPLNENEISLQRAID